MSDNIPFEIQIEIVKRVPVKSLFQFRSVSKSWKSLIDSSQFIADYNACKSRPQRLLIRYDDGHNFGDPTYVCIVDDNIFPQHKFPTTVPMAESFEHLNELRLIGSSQGLLCFLGAYQHDKWYWEKAFIWNPAIRKSIAIDVPVLYGSYATILGFGVCPNTNEPMLVWIHDKDSPSQLVKVFTLSSGVWRSPRSNLPSKSICFRLFQLAIDGFIYWQTTCYKGLNIVSFNMTSEEFVEINLPRSFGKDLSISKLRGSLAVLEHYTDAGKPVCDVWVMEHGVPKLFTKLLTVTTPNARLTRVLGFRKNGEVIFEAKTRDYKNPAVLKVYEPRSKHIKDLGIYGEDGLFFVCSYTETLLLLDQTDNQHPKMKSSPKIQVIMH